MFTSPRWLRVGFWLSLFVALFLARLAPIRADDLDEPALESEDDPIGDVGAESPEQLKQQAAGYHQRGIIRPADDLGSSLKAFVVAADGNLITLVQLRAGAEDIEAKGLVRADPVSPSAKRDFAKKDFAKAAQPRCEVRIFSPGGKHERVGAWPVSFLAQTIGLAPDNQLYIAGSGRAARYDLDGTELAVVDLPQAVLVDKDQDALREAAEAQIEAEKQSRQDRVETLRKQRDSIKAKIEEQSEKSKSARSKSLERQLDQLDATIERLSPESRTVEKVMGEITARVKRVNAIAASKENVFITCPQVKGYGYSVWRTDRDFANPQCIVTGLSGCCGQMDVCCGGGDLWVAENSRHRVVRYDREGTRLAAFGKRDRDGNGAAFGGCCNPMNLCFDKNGDLLVSESNGQVKHFTAKGKFVELAGVADVQSGCKNSAIRTSPDGERIYYIDIQKSQILVLMRDKNVAKKEG